MLNKDILNRLKELHLTPMANELKNQMEHPEAYQTLSFEDRLSLLIDVRQDIPRKCARQCGLP